MGLSDAFERGIGIGQKYGRHSSIRDAIKSVVDKYNQQEELTSTYGTKAVMDRAFADPNEALLNKAKLEQTLAETDRIKNEAAFLSGGGTGSVLGGGRLSKYKVGGLEFEVPKTQEELEREYRSSPDYLKSQGEESAKYTSMVESNKFMRDEVSRVNQAIDKVPMGIWGSMSMGLASKFGVNDPRLAAWQQIKSFLSDLQLGNLQFTKGAISDREMEFFARSVANDDVMSAPRIKMILERAVRRMDSQEKIARESNITMFGGQGGEQQSPTNPFVKPQSSMSDEQAMAEYEAFMRGE